MTRASRKADPEREMAALHERRLALAHKRHALDSVEVAQRAVIDAAPDRKRAARLAEATGAEHSETPEEVQLACRQAEGEMNVCKEKREALRRAEERIAEEENAVIDANPAHYEQKAAEALEEAERLTRAAADAVVAAHVGYRAAGAASGVVWHSCKRRKVEGGPGEWPANDLGRATSDLADALHLLHLLKAKQKSPTAGAAPPRSAPQREPLLERLG